MSTYESAVRTAIGIGSAAPVLPVHNLEAAMRFYVRLGFQVGRHEPGYAYARRERLEVLLQTTPDHDPFSSYVEAYVETTRIDALHAEWLALDLMPIRTIVSPDIRAELRRRWAAGNPVGMISAQVKDQPWGSREFSLRDPDNNHLRFGSSAEGTPRAS